MLAWKSGPNESALIINPKAEFSYLEIISWWGCVWLILIWLILKCLAATNILKKEIWNSYLFRTAVKFLIISLSYALLRFISISCTCNKLASLLYIILLFPVRKCKFAKSFLSKSTSYIFKYVREEEPIIPWLKW